MRRLTPPALVAAYLAAIIIANLTIAAYGPAAAIPNGLVLIALDLVSRDALHEAWAGRGLWPRMLALIAAGSALSYGAALLIPGSLPPALVGGVALASLAAFSAAGLVDAAIYQLGARLSWLARSNASNAAAALVDTLLFVALAPTLGPALLLPVGLPLLAAKIGGGLLWSLALRPAAARP